MHGDLNHIMQLAVKESRRINNITKFTNVNNSGARVMPYDSFDGGDDGEHNDVGLVKISELIVTQEDVFIWNEFIWLIAPY